MIHTDLHTHIMEESNKNVESDSVTEATRIQKQESKRISKCGPFEWEENSNFCLTQIQISILQKIAPFYNEERIETILKPLIYQTSSISLRAIDWLVTNYSKKHNIVCSKYARDTTEIFNIYHGYKLALSHFRRRNFDPFRRRGRIYVVNGTERHQTTVGQCNFIHWAYTTGVLSYAMDSNNTKHIEADMNAASAANKAEKKKQRASGQPKRRRELSTAPPHKCSVYKISSQVVFKPVC